MEQAVGVGGVGPRRTVQRQPDPQRGVVPSQEERPSSAPREPGEIGGDAFQAMLSDIDEVTAALRQAMNGELPEVPPVTLWTPTVFDRGLLPPGSTGDSFYLYPIATR